MCGNRRHRHVKKASGTGTGRFFIYNYLIVVKLWLLVAK
jgi:hypothetical protein